MTNTKYIISCVQCYSIQNEIEKAKYILETYYENLDKDVNYYGLLGNIYYDLKDMDNAIKNYNKAEELDIMTFTSRYRVYREIAEEKIKSSKNNENK